MQQQESRAHVADAPSPWSAEGLHRLAVEAHRTGNRGRLALCGALRALGDTRLHLELGFPSLAAYAERHFQLSRAETYEHVRVAERLDELTELRDAFADGLIGWTALKAVCRVASAGTQRAWLDRAREAGSERTALAVREARRKGRDEPPDDSYGLPNLDEKLVLRFPRSDMERLRLWLDGIRAMIADRTGSDDVSLEQAVLFLAERDRLDRRDGCCETARATRQGDSAHDTQIVYQRCPDCRRSRVRTRDGFVEVDPEEIERHEGCAEPVVVDGPTPPRLRRRILAREAGRCANPTCRNGADHCHHIVFRSRGGPTSSANEVAVCRTCHGLIHAGLLRVAGNADDGELRWTPVLDARAPGRAIAGLGPSVASLPVAVAIRRALSSIEDGSAVKTPPVARDRWVGELAAGLARLGIPRTQARARIERAMATLPRVAWTEPRLLRHALARP